MTDTPPIHVKTEDGELRICFSRAMKLFMALATTALSSLLISMFAFAWSSNDKLGDINERLNGLNQRIDDMNSRVDRLDTRIDRKADR